MRCDVLAVGTELLLGQIIDSNSAWMGGELAANGIDSLVQVKVGDNVGRIAEQLRRMLDDADAVIVCGGLGPTHDDLTREAIAAVMDVELEFDPDIAEMIRQMFAARGRPMVDNNLRQAMVPVGATVIEQVRGTAPGLICPVADGTKVVYAVPGVPHEMKEMIGRAILPDLRRRAGAEAVIVSRVLRTWGESESGLNERLDDIIEVLESPDTPTLAFLASGWEGMKVRLTAKAATADAGRQQLDRWEGVLRERLGDLVFGIDDDTMESVVLDLCRRRGLTLAVAEGVTGGLVAGRLTGARGAHAVFRGSIVTSAADIAADLFGGSPDDPVVGEEVARRMASGVRERLGADIGLALNGVAGRGPTDGSPPGTLHVGLVGPGFDEVRTLRLPGAAEQMRQFSVITALGLLRPLLTVD